MPPEIHVFFGLIATGKSYLAEQWAAQQGIAWYNSDRLRMELAGLAAAERRPAGLNQGIYTREFSRKTYDALLERAEKEISGGRSVVLDASYQAAAERARVVELARRLGVGVRFVLCTCDEDVVRQRLAMRARDPEAVSDGRWEIYQAQKDRFEPPDELDPQTLIVLDTDDTPDNLLVRLAASLRK